MIHSARNEQRLAFRVHRHEWEPVDIDGVHLMLRPHTGEQKPGGPRAGWSKASRYRKAARNRNKPANESE